MTRSALGITLAILVVPLAASAQTVPAFAEADTDGDGEVSIQGAVQAGASRAEAKEADFDGDKTLDKIDWAWIRRDANNKADGYEQN